MSFSLFSVSIFTHSFFQIFILEVLCFFQNIRVHLLRLFRCRFNKSLMSTGSLVALCRIRITRNCLRPFHSVTAARILMISPSLILDSDGSSSSETSHFFPEISPVLSPSIRSRYWFFIGADFHSNGFYHKKVRHFLRGPDIRDINLFHSDGSLPKR